MESRGSRSGAKIIQFWPESRTGPRFRNSDPHASDCYDDLAHMVVQFHIAVCFNDFGKAERLIDKWFECAGSQVIEDVLLGFL